MQGRDRNPTIEQTKCETYIGSATFESVAVTAIAQVPRDICCPLDLAQGGMSVKTINFGGNETPTERSPLTSETQLKIASDRARTKRTYLILIAYSSTLGRIMDGSLSAFCEREDA